VRRSAALRPSVSFAKIGGRLVFVSPGIGTQPFVSFGKTRGGRLVLAENLTKK